MKNTKKFLIEQILSQSNRKNQNRNGKIFNLNSTLSIIYTQNVLKIKVFIYIWKTKYLYNLYFHIMLCF